MDQGPSKFVPAEDRELRTWSKTRLAYGPERAGKLLVGWRGQGGWRELQLPRREQGGRAKERDEWIDGAR